MTGRRLAAAPVALGTAIGGLLLLPIAFDPLHAEGGGPLWGRLLMVSVGWSFFAGGIAAWFMRREQRTGSLLILTGLGWWLVLLIGTRVPILWTISSALEMLFLTLLVYLLLAFPEGRLHSLWERLLVALQVVVFLSGVVFAVFYNPTTFGCTNCPRGLNLLLISDQPDLVNQRATLAGRAEIALLVLLIGTLWTRWVRSSVPRRRILNPLIVPAITFSLAYAAYLLFQQLAGVAIYAAPLRLYEILITVFTVSLLLLPLLLVLGLTRLRSRRARIGDLVLELGELPTPERLQAALARTLGDPSLEVGIWVPEVKRYLGANGRTIVPPEEDPNRVTTTLERHGERLAIIVHDPALLDDTAMIGSVTAATRLAVENEKLQRDLLDQLVEVHDSRARIIEAADEERKRIERNLHDGAQQRLVSLSLALQLVESKLEGAPEAKTSLTKVRAELDDTLRELRELARGMYPAILTDQGLEVAVEALADRSRLPVEVDIDLAGDVPEKVQAAAYFAISEALTNAARHSQASAATTRVYQDDGVLVAEVEDDGLGGASLEEGSGLRGLADRVHALGGDLTIDSGPGKGTRLVIRLPCE